MKKVSFLALTALTLGLFSCNGSAEEVAEDAVKDAVKHELMEDSNIQWVGEKFKDGEFHHDQIGALNFQSGEISVVNGALVAGTFVIDMNSMEKIDQEDAESAAKLIGHLKSDDFFDVEKFPTATVVISGYKDGLAQGVLTLKGIDLPFETPLAFSDKEDRYTLDGELELDFSPFNIDAFEGQGGPEYISSKIKVDFAIDCKK
jgi:polyisoprenoid-binding protein YceI